MSRSAERARAGLARDRSGAAAVEFALVVGLFIMLVIGTIEVGRALMARNAVNHALSQVTRVVHLEPGTTREEVIARLEALLAERAGRGSELQVEIREISGTSFMQIEVLFPFELSVPFLPVRRITMRVETFEPMISPS